uniref:Ionotropic glutamate receptor C-terminal domain-containing protein n=1 Tax=Cacopsylla melanoneura TaxID=428564 RepID=A0A8D8QZA5_9HEMI
MDLALGWFSYADPYLHPGLRLGRTTSIDCFGWGVPWRAGKSPSTWANYVSEFSLGTWTCVIFVNIMFVATLYCFESDRSREALGICIMYAYAMLMEQESKIKNQAFHLRIFLTNWLWYCLIITTAYRASLGSFMTVPAHAKDFNSMTDILKSDLKIVGGPDVVKILEQTSKTSEISRKFLARFQTLPPQDFESVMNQTVLVRDIAVFGVKRFLYYHSRPQAKKIKVKIPFRLIPGCLLRAHTTQLLVQKNSHLYNIINNVLYRLFETGIIDHHILHLGSNRLLPAEKIKGRPLKMKVIWCTFFMLMFGYIVSLIVFLFERKFPPSKNRKHKVTLVKPVDLTKLQSKRQERNFGQRHFYKGQYLW